MAAPFSLASLVQVLLVCGVWGLQSSVPYGPATHAGPRLRGPVPQGPTAARDVLRSREAKPRADLLKERSEFSRRVRDGTGCTPQEPPPDQPALPTVPNSFITDLEITLLDSDPQRVIYGREMYDSSSLRGVLDYVFAEGVVLTRPMMLTELIHYNILMDEALFILTENGCAATGEENCATSKYCTAGKINDLSVELQQLFGIVSTSGSGTFMGAAGILEFGKQFNYTARPNETSCHGIKCQVYETCLVSAEEEASIKYTYYWSSKGWNVQNEGDQVPIAVEINAHGKFGGHAVRDVAIRYDFFDFHREWMPSQYELEPPADTYCVNRKTLLKPPKAVTLFSHKSELVLGFDVFVPDGENQTLPIRLRGMFPKNEWYDWTMRITRQDFLPFFLDGSGRRFENFTSEIHEFNQGLSYIIRPRQNFCKIKRIENITSWGDVEVGPDGSVNIQSPWNFEALDEPLQYNGLHWERGMETDVWAGIRKNPVLGINETVVWYFASPLTHEILGRGSKGLPSFRSTDKVPVKLEKYLTRLEGLPHTLYNIYGYDSKVPTTHQHDISLCYRRGLMKHFVFDLPANSINKTFNMRENLKYAIVEALSEAGRVSPLRINRIELTKTPSAVEVLFTLLETSSKVSDALNNMEEYSMDRAASVMKETIDSSQLVILVKIGGTQTPDPKFVIQRKLVAMPGTMKEVTRDDGTTRGSESLTGYSPGDMAGLAIGMIILGALVGYGALFFYSKK